MLKYWKPITAILILLGSIAFGMHYEALRVTAKELEQANVDIKEANNKIKNNNQVDVIYNETIASIEKNKVEAPNEKGNCSITVNWLRALRRATN